MISKFDWENWLEKEELCRNSFQNYIDKGLIKIETEKENLSKSHMSKANYNLDFINFLLNNKKFYDWVIIGCYYAIYRASLSLITKKGFSSKKHNSTICALIKIYYHDKKKINREDVELVAKSSLSKEEVGYFVQAKEKRETASYGISEEFAKIEAEKLNKDTIKFLNKVKEIIERDN